MLWRDLAGRLFGLAYWIDRVYDESGRVDDSDPVVRELCRLCLEVDRETADQIVRRLGHPPRPTGGHPPAERRKEGKESLCHE